MDQVKSAIQGSTMSRLFTTPCETTTGLFKRNVEGHQQPDSQSGLKPVSQSLSLIQACKHTQIEISDDLVLVPQLPVLAVFMKYWEKPGFNSASSYINRRDI